MALDFQQMLALARQKSNTSAKPSPSSSLSKQQQQQQQQQQQIYDEIEDDVFADFDFHDDELFESEVNQITLKKVFVVCLFGREWLWI